jgi:hypothetical protein
MGSVTILALRNRETGTITKVSVVEPHRVKLGRFWIDADRIGEGKTYVAILGRLRPGEPPPSYR